MSYPNGLGLFPFLTLHSRAIRGELGNLGTIGKLGKMMSAEATERGDGDCCSRRREVSEHLRQIPKRTRLREDVDGA